MAKAKMGDADTKELSGGQQKRVALAQLLAGEWDCLILDEPTNHLDLDAIAFLEEWLAKYNGGLIMVTHDDRIAQRCERVVRLRDGAVEIDRPGGRRNPRAAAHALAQGHA